MNHNFDTPYNSICNGCCVPREAIVDNMETWIHNYSHTNMAFSVGLDPSVDDGIALQMAPHPAFQDYTIEEDVDEGDFGVLNPDSIEVRNDAIRDAPTITWSSVPGDKTGVYLAATDLVRVVQDGVAMPMDDSMPAHANLLFNLMQMKHYGTAEWENLVGKAVHGQVVEWSDGAEHHCCMRI